MSAYVFFVEGFEETEGITTLDILRRGGIQAASVSLEDSKTVVGGQGIKIETDLLFKDLNYAEADLIVLPGGPGTHNYQKNPGFLDFVKTCAQAGKSVCAICAAPTVLAGLNILEGKNATCYPAPPMIDILKQNGAVYTESIVVKDGNVITSSGPGTTPYFALEIVKTVKGEEAANAVKQGFLLHLI